MTSGLLQLSFNRDATGRPVAIRVGFDGSQVGFLARRLARGSIGAALGLANLVRAGSFAISTATLRLGRALVPHAEVRRGPTGRPETLVLRLGLAPACGGPASNKKLRVTHRGPTVVIGAQPASILDSAREVWSHRALYTLLFKEITMRKVRGSLLGVWWLILRPLITAAGFFLSFAFVARVNTDRSVPYSVFFLSGFIPWQLFQGAMAAVPRSLISTRAIMRHASFPRLLLPLAGFGTVLIECGILIVAFVVVVVSASWGDALMPLRLGWQMLWLVPCLVSALMFALAFGMALSVVALAYKDIVFSVGYVTQIFMFVTPVLYPLTFVPGSRRWILYSLNPMAQVVTVSRWALTGVGEFEPLFVALAFGTILAAFLAGLIFFLRAETRLGDLL